MKKFLTVLLCAIVSAACVFAFVGCGSGEDYSDEISQLQRQIGDLRAQLDAEKQKVTALEQSFTGSPKFNYSGIGETISYYIKGTKIFDFKIDTFEYNDNATIMIFTVEFNPAFSAKADEVFSGCLYDPATSYVYYKRTMSESAITFAITSGTEAVIILYYLSNPFACITATPTRS